MRQETAYPEYKLAGELEQIQEGFRVLAELLGIVGADEFEGGVARFLGAGFARVGRQMEVLTPGVGAVGQGKAVMLIGPPMKDMQVLKMGQDHPQAVETLLSGYPDGRLPIGGEIGGGDGVDEGGGGGSGVGEGAAMKL